MRRLDIEPPPLKKERVMIANWKSLAVPLIGLAPFVWLGPHSDSRNSEVTQQMLAIAPGCATHSGRCMVDIRFTYPAADLSVLADDVYF
jgi:hypothetical protein